MRSVDTLVGMALVIIMAICAFSGIVIGIVHGYGSAVAFNAFLLVVCGMMLFIQYRESHE